MANLKYLDNQDFELRVQNELDFSGLGELLRRLSDLDQCVNIKEPHNQQKHFQHV